MTDIARPTALYRLFEGDVLLYVGVADRWTRRLSQHASGKAWFGTVSRVTVEVFPTREGALAAELAAIRVEHPKHNIVGMGTRNVPRDPARIAEREPRYLALEDADLLPDSLVGSWFLATAERGWQGCIVAEPQPGLYLVQLFEWVMGEAGSQRLVRIEEMADWTFYDDPDAMKWEYEHIYHRRWEQEYAAKDAADENTTPDAADENTTPDGSSVD